MYSSKIPHIFRSTGSLIICFAAIFWFAGMREAGTQSFVLSDLLMRRVDGKPVPVTTVDEWEQQRLDIKRRVFDLMGQFPAERVPLDPKDIGQEKLDGYTRIKVSYQTEATDRVIAYLLVPANVKGKAPAVIAMHRTDPDGKAHVVGLKDTPELQYGLDLVRRGYVVLAPDCITAGERVIPGAKSFETALFDRAHPNWSAMGKMIWDHIRGLDYLASLPFVDGNRIGSIGVSLGGTNAFCLAAFDPRVQAVVSSSGFATMAGDENPYRWSRADWFVFFPELKSYLDIKVLPFDFHEILALVAPRALLNISGRDDKVIPHWQWVVGSALDVTRVYQLLGVESKFQNIIHDDGHGFPSALHETAYAWLDRYLKQ